jgi:hypothetical protein
VVYHVVAVFETVHLVLGVQQLPMLLLQLMEVEVVVLCGHDEAVDVDVAPEEHEDADHVDAAASFAVDDGASFVVVVADENTFKNCKLFQRINNKPVYKIIIFTYLVEYQEGSHFDGLDMVHELLVAERSPLLVMQLAALKKQVLSMIVRQLLLVVPVVSQRLLSKAV